MIWPALKKHYPNPSHYLHWETNEQLLVATILSAQCTDVRVNKTTPSLFKKFPSVKAFAHADIKELELAITPCGFFRTKAKAIKGANSLLIRYFNSTLPSNFDDLLTLPGVGRKTANALQQNAFNMVEGIVVDTHVIRLANRFLWSPSKNAIIVERELMELLPLEDWHLIPGILKAHGKSVCIAQSPRCKDCFLSSICPSSKYTTAQPGLLIPY